MHSITIALTRYNEPNILFHQVLFALSQQVEVFATVFVLDQIFDRDTELFCRKITHSDILFRYIHIHSHNLSYARNFAIQQTKTPMLLYLDADAIPNPTWALELSNILSMPGVGIVGGKIIPKYEISPLYIHRYRRVQNFYSLLDLGVGISPVQKIVGASFGIHVDRIGSSIIFDQHLGRQEGLLLSGEETDFCSRVINEGLKVYYIGSAIVQHYISKERISYVWLWKRVFYQGVTRAISLKTPSLPTITESKGFLYYFFLFLFSLARILGYIYGFLVYKILRISGLVRLNI